jgi:site-specific DNA-methyltransferase (adenine-specific)
MKNQIVHKKAVEKSMAIEVLPPSDVFAAIDEVENRRLRPAVTMLDPWYNKGVGGVIPDADYDDFINKLLQRSCAISDHVYLWGFPEIIGPYVRSVPKSHTLLAWLTWYYKNNPSVIRGWRSSQMACLHIAKPDAPVYPQNFLSQTQKNKLKEGSLRYMPGPTSVIESALLIGFVGKTEQTGHPAQKPVAVYDKLIRMVTTENDLVFDPMCGSGTTGVVAKVRGLRSILNDKEQSYVDIARFRTSREYPGLSEKLDSLGNNPDKAEERASARKAAATRGNSNPRNVKASPPKM